MAIELSSDSYKLQRSKNRSMSNSHAVFVAMFVTLLLPETSHECPSICRRSGSTSSVRHSIISL